MLRSDLKKRTIYNLDKLIFKMENKNFEHIKFKNYRMLDALRPYLKEKEFNLPIYNLFNIDPLTMISRYVTNPYVDKSRSMFYQDSGAVSKEVDTNKLYAIRMNRTEDVPY